jgi:hypothetical protein
VILLCLWRLYSLIRRRDRGASIGLRVRLILLSHLVGRPFRCQKVPQDLSRCSTE